MKRRRYFVLTGTVLSTGVAGCNGLLTDEEEEPEDDNGIESAFRDAMTEHGFEIDHIAVGGDRLVTDYQTTSATEQELLEEMQLVATAYAEVVTPEWEVELAELWMNDPDIGDHEERVLGSYLVRNEWVFAWRDNEMTDEELMEHILESIEITEQFQERFGGS